MSQRRTASVHLGTTDPTVNDDLSVRCYPGDLWVRRSTGGAWVLTDDADGAAVWLAVGGGGGGGGGSHSGLTSLAWTVSGHTGTASRIAAFDGAGATSYLQIGVDVLAYDAGLTSLTGVDTVADRYGYTTAANTWAAGTITAFGRSVLDDADAAAGRATLAAAPVAGPYVVTTASAELTAETVLTAGALVTLGGAATIGVTFTATQRIAARTTAGAGAGEEVSLSQVLDWISTTHGAVIFRGAAGWQALAPGGTPGHQLTTQGVGADPTWAAAGGGGAATIGSSTATFSTGDTWARKNIVDAAATATSKILVGVQSPAYADDPADPGWAYSAQVVLRAAGSFDVVVHAIPVWEAASEPEGPGTTVTIYYLLG